MVKVTCKADVSIARIKGLDPVVMGDFMSRLKASPKCRERRSLLRECRSWFKRHCPEVVKAAKIGVLQYSQQDGCYV